LRPAPPAVLYVEYDCGGRRVSKRFDNVSEAKRFYTLKRK
jgi:hypothetical protein